MIINKGEGIRKTAVTSVEEKTDMIASFLRIRQEMKKVNTLLNDFLQSVNTDFENMIENIW